jgi:hypothetical protein
MMPSFSPPELGTSHGDVIISQIKFAEPSKLQIIVFEFVCPTAEESPGRLGRFDPALRPIPWQTQKTRRKKGEAEKYSSGPWAKVYFLS